MEVFIQNLKAYNCGVILGGWFKLGDTEENLVCEFYKLDIAEQEKINAILESGFYYDLEQAMEHRDNYALYKDIQSEEDFGHFLVEELETCQVPDYIKRYINYEEYGRDEIINSNGHLTMFGYLEEA